MATADLTITLESADAMARIDAVTDCAQRASAAVADLHRAIEAAESLEIGIAIVQRPAPFVTRRNRFVRALRVLAGRD